MLAGLAGFMLLPSPWDWIVPFAILLAGGVLAEGVVARIRPVALQVEPE